MSLNTILIVLAVLLGAAYFAKRATRKNRESKSQARRSRAM